MIGENVMKNKKIWICIIIILLICIIAVGIKVLIDFNIISISANSTVGEISESTEDLGELKYEIHDNYNEGTYDYSKSGYYVDTQNKPKSPWLYIITMGEKNPGGYSIKVLDVKIDEEENVKVIVKEIRKNEAIDEETSVEYPAVCLEFNKKPNSINIVNTYNKEFKKLK